MPEPIDRGRRIRAFTRLFLGIMRDFWKETRLARRHGLRFARERLSARHRRRAIQFRETAIGMGGVLIKLGQFFSTRVDVMPEEYIEELAKLQDTVPPVPFEEIEGLVEAEFGRPIDEVYAEFDREAWAAASLAQVHKAVLPTGERVAVKVQRPGIERLADTDLATFSYLMEGLHRFTRVGRQIDIPMIVDEFVRTVGDELDFYREGLNAERFKANFADNPIIYVPKVYWDYTTDRVLTLEAVDGLKISDYPALEADGIDRRRVAQEVLESYLKQVLEDGFFHADPHPGNLFVVAGPVITFVDFGMVGEITPPMKAAFRQALIGIAQKDSGQLIDALRELGFIRPAADVQAVRNAIDWTFDNYASVSSRTLTFDKVEEIHEDILRIIREQPLMVPAQFAFLGKAIGTLLGLVTGLDPKIDVVEATKPYVQRLTAAMARNWQEIVIGEARSLAMTLLRLPKQIEDTLDKAQRGQLTVRLDNGSWRNGDRPGRGSRLWPAALVASVFGASGAALTYQGLSFEGYTLVGLAAGLFVLALAFGRRR